MAATTIKQNDTSIVIPFLLIQSADHISPLTGAAPTVVLSKNGAAFAAPAGAVAEIGNGWYKLTPTSADTGTVGPLVVHVTATSADPQDLQVDIVAYDPKSATNLGLTDLDAAVSTRQPSGNVTVGGYAAGQDPASLVLITPANKVLTNASGDVTATNGGGSASEQQKVSDNLFRTNETITEKFAVLSAGSRVTAGSFAVLARDADGGDISSQIAVSADGTAAGVYKYSFTPTLEGVYYVSVKETTTGQYYDSLFRVGGATGDRIWSLANQGQAVALGNGGGGLTYSGTVTLSGQAQAGVVVKCYSAQDTAGADQNAIVDLQTLVAQATSDGSGQFSLLLAQGYYALVYVVAGTLYQYYLRWSVSQAKWITATSPIAAS